MTLQLNHISFFTADVAATHRFWSELLGLPVAFAVELGGGGLHWAYALGEGQLIVFETGTPGRLAGHLGLVVPAAEDRERWRNRLRQAGVHVRIEDPGPEERLYFEDPNGVTLEIEIRWDPPAQPDALQIVSRQIG